MIHFSPVRLKKVFNSKRFNPLKPFSAHFVPESPFFSGSGLEGSRSIQLSYRDIPYYLKT
jgi:hypothetical protein